MENKTTVDFEAIKDMTDQIIEELTERVEPQFRNMSEAAKENMLRQQRNRLETIFEHIWRAGMEGYSLKGVLKRLRDGGAEI